MWSFLWNWDFRNYELTPQMWTFCRWNLVPYVVSLFQCQVRDGPYFLNKLCWVDWALGLAQYAYSFMGWDFAQTQLISGLIASWDDLLNLDESDLGFNPLGLLCDSHLVDRYERKALEDDTLMLILAWSWNNGKGLQKKEGLRQNVHTSPL